LTNSRLTQLRMVAIFEVFKGILVLVAAGALYRLLHPDAQRAAEELVRHFHLNPASRYPRIFLQAATHLSNVRLLVLSLGAMAYAAVRFAEAYGLWRGRNWARVLAFVGAAVYVPLELIELAKRITWAGSAVLLINLLILLVLWRGRVT
jgi:uncharacterized membrane protein (DUF2068 family)